MSSHLCGLAACCVAVLALIRLHIQQRRREYADLYTPEIIKELKRQRRLSRQKESIHG